MPSDGAKYSIVHALWCKVKNETHAHGTQIQDQYHVNLVIKGKRLIQIYRCMSPVHRKATLHVFWSYVDHVHSDTRILAEGHNKDRLLLRHEASVQFNVTTVNKYDIWW